MFYVYEWFNVETGEIFYVGKGSYKRYKSKQHNKMFKDYIKRYPCSSRILRNFQIEQDAFEYEFLRIEELKHLGQCSCNIYRGGIGGTHEHWNDERRKQLSVKNGMKDKQQRERMKLNNPMRNPEIAMRTNSQKMKQVIINEVVYKSAKVASEVIGVHVGTIYKWCKRGYDTQGSPVRYANEPQKDNKFKMSSSKKVVVDGIVFKSVKEAAKHIGVWSESLIRCIKANKLCKGHFCRYDNQHPSREKSDNSITEGSTTNE